MTVEKRLDEITVGERDREDLGDISSLAASILDVGLLHPVVVTPDLHLVAGGRRLAAVKHLGWTEVPVTIVDLRSVEAALRAEADENTCRLALTPLEAARARKRRAEVLAPLAKKREKAGVKSEPRSKLDQGPSGRTRQAAAVGTGYSDSTLDKVDEITAAADNPAAPDVVKQTAAEAVAAIESGEPVDRAHKRVSLAEKYAQAVAEFPELTHYDRDRKRAVDLAQALREFDPIERKARMENLRKSIAAAKRRATQPKTDPAPDHYQHAAAMFTAASDALSVINRNGGADVMSIAAQHLDGLEITTWSAQFADLAAVCTAVAKACRPTIRRVQ